MSTTTSIEAALKQRFLRNQIDLIARHPSIFNLLSSQHDVPTIELALTDGLKIARHDKQKPVILLATAFNLYLCKLTHSTVLSAVGASTPTMFKNATIQPYCRWALNSIEAQVDPRDGYSIIISMTDYPMNDAGEALFVDEADDDAQKMMGVGFAEFDGETGGYTYYRQQHGAEDDAEEELAALRRARGDLDDTDREHNNEDGGAKKSSADDGKKKPTEAANNINGINELPTFPAWKVVVVEFASADIAQLAVTEITRLCISSVVLREKWSRRRMRTDGSGFEYAGGMSDSDEKDDEEEEQADDDDGGEKDDQSSKKRQQQQQQKSGAAGPKKKALTAEEQRKKRATNRLRNKNAQEVLSLAGSSGSGVLSAESLRAAAEMRKVAALVSADGVSDVKLMRDVLMSRRAAVQARSKQQQEAAAAALSGNNTKEHNNNNNNAEDAIVDPIELLKQHVQQNELAMERVFSNHYEKFLTFIDKTTQISVDGVERVQFSHEAIGNAIDRCAEMLRHAASSVVESRMVVSRVAQVSESLRRRVSVARLLESAERCLGSRNVFGLAEILDPLQQAVVGDGGSSGGSGLSASDTLAIYVVQIRLPQLRASALSMATAKLHAWLASLRDCVMSLGEDLWKKSIEDPHSSGNGDDNDDTAAAAGPHGKRLNRMSERVEHVHKRIVNVEPLKSDRSFGWRIEKSIVPTTVDDVAMMFLGESTAQLAATAIAKKAQEQLSILSSITSSSNKGKSQFADPGASSFEPPSSKQQQPQSRLARMKTEAAVALSVTPLSATVASRQGAPSPSATPSLADTFRREASLSSAGISAGVSDFRGASYGSSLRHLFRLCGAEQQIVSTVLETRRLHLATLVQSICEPPSAALAATAAAASSSGNGGGSSSSSTVIGAFFTTKGFVADCTRALGFLHCEEMLVNNGDVDLTVSHLLSVWISVQKAIAARVALIGRRNPPSCAALFRTLTHFKTAALGCLLTPLPDSSILDQARQQQRDNMQATMANTITGTLQQLVEMDDLQRLEVADGRSYKKSVLALNLQLAGARALPIPDPVAAGASTAKYLLPAARAISAPSPSIAAVVESAAAASAPAARSAFGATRTFGSRQRHGTSTSTTTVTASTTTTTTTTATVAASAAPAGASHDHRHRESQPPRFGHSTAPASSLASAASVAAAKFSTPMRLPFSNIVPAAGDLLLGFLNEAFSLGYDSGIDGGLVGANSDEARANQGNRVIDPETGVMTDILDGSCHREWVDSTSLAMVEVVLKQLGQEMKNKMTPLYKRMDLQRLALLRNNFVATRTVLSTLEQRYALLFHGALEGTQPYFPSGVGGSGRGTGNSSSSSNNNNAALLPESALFYDNVVVESEQFFTLALLEKVTALLQPMSKMSYWEGLYEETESDIKRQNQQQQQDGEGGGGGGGARGSVIPPRDALTRLRSERAPPAPRKKDGDGAAEPSEISEPTTLRLVHLPAFVHNRCVVQAAVGTIIEIIEFLQQGGPSADVAAAGGSIAPVWPEHLACAQARTAVCRVADCIRDSAEHLVQKCELRMAGRLLRVLPLIASSVQNAVETMMDRLNNSVRWTSAHSASSAASTSAMGTPILPSMRSTAAASASASGGGGGVIVFPFDNLDGYFCNLYALVEVHAKEYEKVGAKIGANMDLVTSTAMKGATAALSGMMKLGDFGIRGVKSVVETVADKAKVGMTAVAGAAEDAVQEIGGVVTNLRKEMTQDDSDAEDKSEKLDTEEKRRRHQWDQPGEKKRTSFFSGKR